MEAADMAVEAKEEDPNGHVAHVRFNRKAFFSWPASNKSSRIGT
jgi:hypothetical protein